jgi:hypothetical protein
MRSQIRSQTLRYSQIWIKSTFLGWSSRSTFLAFWEQKWKPKSKNTYVRTAKTLTRSPLFHPSTQLRTKNTDQPLRHNPSNPTKPPTGLSPLYPGTLTTPNLRPTKLCCHKANPSAQELYGHAELNYIYTYLRRSEMNMDSDSW